MLEIARCGSINKAAANLIVSQPYLSGIIKSIEDEVGYEIFIRTKSGIELTANGNTFMNHARIILDEMHTLLRIGDRQDNMLRISTYFSTFFMRKYLEFRNEFGADEHDSLHEMGNIEVMDSVLYGNSSIGIVVYAEEKRAKYLDLIESRGLRHHELYRHLRLYAIMSEDHPLSGRPEISMETLRSYPYVAYDDDSSQLYLANQLGLKPEQQGLRVSGRGGFYDALRTGVYLSATASPELGGDDDAKRTSLDGFTALRISDADLYLESRYITARGHQLTEREQNFVDFLKS